METNQKTPEGELAIRTLAMPADANPDGKVFGGWIVSHMDLAGLSAGRKYTRNRLVTVAIQSMSFISPVHIGDFVCCYTQVEKIGRTSLVVKIETWAVGPREAKQRLVTTGVFTYVAMDEQDRPTPIETQL